MKHTKGPWRVKRHKHSGFIIDGATLPDKIIPLAFVEAKAGYDIGIKEDKANAHLIAAAPELLEACNTILNRFGGHVRDYEEMTAGQKLAIERTVEAIRKAEGKN